jgi:hypothetical protein
MEENTKSPPKVSKRLSKRGDAGEPCLPVEAVMPIHESCRCRMKFEVRFRGRMHPFVIRITLSKPSFPRRPVRLEPTKTARRSERRNSTESSTRDLGLNSDCEVQFVTTQAVRTYSRRGAATISQSESPFARQRTSSAKISFPLKTVRSPAQRPVGPWQTGRSMGRNASA